MQAAKQHGRRVGHIDENAMAAGGSRENLDLLWTLRFLFFLRLKTPLSVRRVALSLRDTPPTGQTSEISHVLTGNWVISLPARCSGVEWRSWPGTS